MTAPHRSAIVLITALAVLGLVPAGSPASAGGSDAPSEPVLASASHATGVWDRDTRISIAWTGPTNPGPGVAGYSFAWDTNPVAPSTMPTPPAMVLSAVSPPLPDGDSHFFHVVAVDVNGAVGAALDVGPFFIDATPPAEAAVSGPDLERMFQRSQEIEFSYSASDALSGVVLVEVRYREARFNGSFTEITTLQATPVRTRWLAAAGGVVRFRGSPGTTYCFSVRATDAAGNRSQVRAERCTSVPVNDRTLVRRGRWDRGFGRGYYLGTYTQSRRRGAVLFRGDVRARQLAILATTCRRCGKVRVYFRNKLVARISLRSRVTRKRHLVPLRSFPFPRKGLVQIIVASKRRIVRVEGLGVSAAKL